MLQTSLVLMKSLNKIETPIFYLFLCVLCFQRQPFRFLFFLFFIFFFILMSTHSMCYDEIYLSDNV